MPMTPTHYPYPIPFPINPECKADRHYECDRAALDPVFETFTYCGCDCHDWAE